MGLPEGEKSFWFWKVLEIVMVAVFVGAALVLLFHLFRKLFRLIQQYMSFHYREQELQTGGAFDLREKCEIEKDTQRKSLGLFGVLAPPGADTAAVQEEAGGSHSGSGPLGQRTSGDLYGQRVGEETDTERHGRYL